MLFFFFFNLCAASSNYYIFQGEGGSWDGEKRLHRVDGPPDRLRGSVGIVGGQHRHSSQPWLKED